jgi:hypothetical protein
MGKYGQWCTEGRQGLGLRVNEWGWCELNGILQACKWPDL